MAETITVMGVGTAKTKPDYVNILLDLKGENAHYSAAVEEANQKIELLKHAVTQIGFEEDDLKTLNFSARTIYEYTQNNSRKFKGYSCDYHLKISFDFTPETLAKVLTAITNSKANAEFSINFTVKEPQKIADELLISATENARGKAEVLCTASGKKLGKLVSINYSWGEIEFISRSSYEINECRTLGVPEFTPDDIESQDSVTFVWEFA